MWGWLSSIADNLKTLWQAITNLPGLIGDAFSGFFSDIGDKLSDIWDSITNLPDLILEGLKEIFIPDTDYINNALDSFVDELKFKFAINTDVFEELFTSEQPVTDIDTDYNVPGVGNFNLVMLDTSFLKTGVQYFRPFIRGFLVLLMFLYHVKQVVGFFGYDAGVVAGRNETIMRARKGDV